MPGDRAQSFQRSLAKLLRWVRDRVPPGVRTLIGLLLVAGGVFGFLPILGFWMIPLGFAVIMLDLRALWIVGMQWWHDQK
ncbi:hypothetical protein C1J03_23640 (plasmid) [Sulfitobacter sp. SK012]|nr:hypothetical protein C1J03_23640 [Sulfitobacter sp. SK012]